MHNHGIESESQCLIEISPAVFNVCTFCVTRESLLEFNLYKPQIIIYFHLFDFDLFAGGCDAIYWVDSKCQCIIKINTPMIVYIKSSWAFKKKTAAEKFPLEV